MIHCFICYRGESRFCGAWSWQNLGTPFIEKKLQIENKVEKQLFI